MSLGEGLLTIVGLALITVATRGLFFLSEREIPVPPWLLQGMRYAPLAALTAVVAPAIVMSDGLLIGTWRDARLFAAAAGVGWWFWRRSVFGTILAGMAVLLALRHGLGW